MACLFLSHGLVLLASLFGWLFHLHVPCACLPQMVMDSIALFSQHRRSGVLCMASPDGGPQWSHEKREKGGEGMT
jgi:hypothetical protein